MKRIITAIALAAATLGLGACTEVPVGHQAVSVTQGTLNGTEGEGLAWHIPLFTDIIPFNLQTQKMEATTTAYTQDVQQAKIKYTVTYRLDPSAVAKTYQNVGVNYEDTLIPQVVEQAIKDVFGNSEAVKDTINDRPGVQAAITTQLLAGLSKRSIILQGFEIADIGFSTAFEDANEQKQIAVETANAEKNKTVAVEERAKQKIITAKAEAEAMKIKSQALSGNPGLTAYEYATRWDGKMPGIVTSENAPMMLTR